jgi:hypothetical protein
MATVTSATNDSSQERSLLLGELRREFPQYTIWQEVTPGRARYNAVRARPGIRPYAVVSSNPGELRAVLSEARPPGAAPDAAQGSVPILDAGQPGTAPATSPPVAVLRPAGAPGAAAAVPRVGPGARS